MPGAVAGTYGREQQVPALSAHQLGDEPRLLPRRCHELVAQPKKGTRPLRTVDLLAHHRCAVPSTNPLGQIGRPAAAAGTGGVRVPRDQLDAGKGLRSRREGHVDSEYAWPVGTELAIERCRGQPPIAVDPFVPHCLRAPLHDAEAAMLGRQQAAVEAGPDRPDQQVAGREQGHHHSAVTQLPQVRQPPGRHAPLHQADLRAIEGEHHEARGRSVRLAHPDQPADWGTIAVTGRPRMPGRMSWPSKA